MGKKNRTKKKQTVSYQAKRKKKDMRMLTMVTVGLVVLILAIFGIAQLAADGQKEEINRLAQGQPVLGDPKAPVTLIEFGDFKCPVCKRFEETVFPSLKKEYIDTGKVKMAFLNMQFIGPDSVTAGIAGESIYRQNPQAFWQFYDAIYRNQQDEYVIWATPEFLVQLAKQHVSGIDVKRLEQDIRTRKYESDVQRDMDSGKKLGINSVPTIYVNGKKVENPLDYNQLKQALDQALQDSGKKG